MDENACRDTTINAFSLSDRGDFSSPPLGRLKPPLPTPAAGGATPSLVWVGGLPPPKASTRMRRNVSR